jgi:hypothetical protein
MDFGSNMNVGGRRLLSKMRVEMDSFGEGIFMTVSQRSSSIDKWGGLRAEVDLGLCRHGATTDVGGSRVGGVGVGSVGWRVGLRCGYDKAGRGVHGLVIDQRLSSRRSRGSSHGLSMVRDVTNIGGL